MIVGFKVIRKHKLLVYEIVADRDNHVRICLLQSCPHPVDSEVVLLIAVDPVQVRGVSGRL